MEVDPGKLDKRIEIMNEDGTTVYKCWAAVNQLSGTEIAKNNIKFEQTTTRFLIRYTKTEITSEMDIKFAGANYDIQYSNDYNMSHEFIEIIAIRRAYREV